MKDLLLLFILIFLIISNVYPAPFLDKKTKRLKTWIIIVLNIALLIYIALAFLG